MNIREFIRIVEQEQIRKFYHGSSTKLPIGTILKPRGDAYEADWKHTDFYSVLELYRPLDMLSHKDSVFMCDNADDVDLAGGGTDWLLTVIPMGKIERHDLNWSSEISILMDDPEPNENEIRKAAENYWNGIPHHDENVWEYLTPSAEVIAVEEY